MVVDVCVVSLHDVAGRRVKLAAENGWSQNALNPGDDPDGLEQHRGHKDRDACKDLKKSLGVGPNVVGSRGRDQGFVSKVVGLLIGQIRIIDRYSIIKHWNNRINRNNA